jgi:hypothetical protein
MKFKLLALIFVSLFLISSVSAVNIYGQWENAQTDISITQGDSVSFDFVAYSAAPPMVLNVKLYDLSFNLLESIVSDFEFDGFEYIGGSSITSSMYNNQAGNYILVISGSDTEDEGSSITLDLEVESLADNQNPVVTINFPVEGATYSQLIDTIAYDITDNAELSTCWVSQDNGVTTNNINCNSEVYDSLNAVQGSNTWTIYASDSSGNSVTESVTFNVNLNVDNTAPIITLVTPVEGSVYDNAELIFQILTNEMSETSFRLDGADDVSMNSADGLNHGLQVTLTEGDHTVIMIARDTANNVANKTVSFSVNLGNIDNVAPVVTMSYPRDGETYDSHRTRMLYTVYDANLDSCWYSLDGGLTNNTLTTCGGTILDVKSEEGSNTWVIYARDNAGNIGLEIVTFEVDLDRDDDDDDDDRNLRLINYFHQDDFNYLSQFNTTTTIDLTEDKADVRGNGFFRSLWNFIKSIFGF